MTKIKTHIALFAGLGGFILSANTHRIKTLLANEINDNCVKTLKENFPNVKIVNSDVRDLSLNKHIKNEEIDLLTAGFPCQSFSIAGENRGFDDPRGKLFFEILRILKELKNPPKIILLENVPNLKLYNSGERLMVIIRELRSLGYWVNQNNAMILNTNKFGGSPQSRERLFIVALHSSYFKSNRISEDNLKQIKPTNLWELIDRDEQKNDSYYLSKENKHYHLIKKLLDDYGNNYVYQIRRSIARVSKNEGVCPTLTANMGLGGHNVPFISDKHGIRSLTIEELLILQGIHEKEFSFPKISNSAKKEMIGNAVHPKVVTEILNNIIQLYPNKMEKIYA